MDKKGNSLDTLQSPIQEDGTYQWAEHLDTCAERLREIGKMTALPHNVKQINYIANDLELLATRLRHPATLRGSD